MKHVLNATQTWHFHWRNANVLCCFWKKWHTACETLTSCIKCDSTSNNCLMCAVGTFLNEEEKCEQCSTHFEHCEECSPNECTICNVGFFPQNGKCVCLCFLCCFHTQLVKQSQIALNVKDMDRNAQNVLMVLFSQTIFVNVFLFVFCLTHSLSNNWWCLSFVQHKQTMHTMQRWIPCFKYKVSTMPKWVWNLFFSRIVFVLCSKL